MTDFQKMMVRFMREQFPQIVKEAYKDIHNVLKDSSEKIEDKEEKSALSSENKKNRNKENYKHMERKTKEIGIIRPNKLKNTREALDMVRSGLVRIQIALVNSQSFVCLFIKFLT